MTGGARAGTGGHLFERGENGQNGLGVMWESGTYTEPFFGYVKSFLRKLGHWSYRCSSGREARVKSRTQHRCSLLLLLLLVG